MTTSGTVGKTTLDATSFIEHAVRRCGVLVSSVTSEQMQSAIENLYLILSNFTTKGMQLWVTTKTVYPLALGAAYQTLNVGTTDVLNVLIRTVVTDTNVVIGTGLVTYTPTAGATLVNSVTLGVPAGTYNLVLEASPDGITWTQTGSLALVGYLGGLLSFDSDILLTQPYWRVRETLAGTVVFTYAAFLNSANEIPSAPLSRDDYANLPNKAFGSAQSLQYWYDRQAINPRLWLWPVPNDATHQLVVWAQRQVQDVTSFTNTIEIPQRWQDAVIFELSTRVVMELPKEMVSPDRYPQLMERAATTLADAMDAETDGSPVRINPGIRGYTA